MLRWLVAVDNVLLPKARRNTRELAKLFQALRFSDFFKSLQVDTRRLVCPLGPLNGFATVHQSVSNFIENFKRCQVS